MAGDWKDPEVAVVSGKGSEVSRGHQPAAGSDLLLKDFWKSPVGSGG